MFNKIRTILFSAAVAVACLSVSSVPVQAALGNDQARWPHNLGIGGADQETTCFSGRGATNQISGTVSSNEAYFITSAAASGYPRVTYVNWVTDMGNIGSTGSGLTPLTFWKSTNSVTVLTNQAASTNRFTVASTASLATNDRVVLRNLTNDTYQLLVISNIDSATVFSTYQSTSNALSINDIFYEMVPASQIPVANLSTGTITEKIVPQGIYHGDEGKPLLITVGASNNLPSLTVSGEFYKRLRP